MTTYVAFLRGVNLGAQRAVSMPRLVKIAEGLGYEDVWTYLRTGNLALRTEEAAATVERRLERALEEEHGASIGVTVRTAAALRATLDANPFPEGSPSRVSVTFLAGPAPAGLEERIGDVATPAERHEVHGREVWVDFADGQARSRLAATFARVVGVSATTRTVGTVGRLVAKLESRAAGTA